MLMKAPRFAMKGRPPRRLDNRSREERYLYGLHPVSAWLEQRPSHVEVLMYDPAVQRAAELARRVTRLGKRAEPQSRSKLDEFVGGARHQGMVAICEPFPYVPFEQILAAAPARLLVADQLQDPQNLGAIIRTAEASGVGAVILQKDRCVGVGAAAEVAAAGAAARMPISRVTNTVRMLEIAKSRGYWVVGLATKGGTCIFKFDPPEKLVVVLGGEAGMRSLVQRQCDFVATIPMRGNGESLNASVAAGVALFEICRHDLTKP